ncbi:SDR family NAD(P)-dependent oxidoreductase [Catalinimonas niigatensis]|uniref:SDR family NAD(P)-dependent oxidoreductase n=1 Tax=Catalinimonas niigatensis TaxID=1397264 RepID=UPI002665F4CE|nr:SDR family oxidoreductase [Catalinimonas niigatensis]WPP50667.1 SDR family oxidoreductase [Catalinimonas niigatensis]
MNYTLITGASSGIGAAIARRCAREGFNLILVARTTHLLEALAKEIEENHKVVVQVITADLLSPNAAYHLYTTCQKNKWPVRILINNAGLGLWGNFQDLSLEHMVEMMQLNQQLLVELTHFFIPMLREVPYAHILNVSSTASFQPVPYFSVYAASKSFVLSFSRGLRKELEPYKINVSCLCPGPTESEFFSKSGFKKIDWAKGAFMKTGEVADIAINSLLEKKAIIIPGFSNSIGAFFSKHLPSGLMAALTGKYFQPK